MLQLKNKSLQTATVDLLQKYQDAVNTKTTFEEKVAEGKRLFSKYNKKTNAAFKEVRGNLAIMSGGTIRCNYCEDSNANQVEHIYPKKHYPEKCFIWINYCYACGPCNQPKSDHFAVFESETGMERDLKDLKKGEQPPLGMALLIDPRIEDPMDFLFLDTKNTFKFVPFSDNGSEKRRAEYTIKILGLNSRNNLVRARKIAFNNYKSRLFEYVIKKEAGSSVAILAPLIDSLKSEHHQTVWNEMIRQRVSHPEINDLLNRATEALFWR